MTSFLPKRYFERLVEKSNDRTKSWSISFWNQLLVLIFGQLDGCNSLRELTDITIAHSSKSYHLGFGKTPITRSTLSKANMLRDYRVFESFAYHMVNLAQQKRIDKEFDLNGTFYAFDSTTIDLCLSLYDWARFRSTKSGIKVHTQLDIRTEISTSFTITDAVVHDVNAMDSIAYEPFACYIFDRGYFDLRRLYVSIRPTTGIKPLYTTIATVTMNLIVSAAIVLLNPYVTVYISYKIPPFALSVHIPDVSTSIYVEVDSKVLLGLPSCDKAFVR